MCRAGGTLDATKAHEFNDFRGTDDINRFRPWASSGGLYSGENLTIYSFLRALFVLSLGAKAGAIELEKKRKAA